MVSSLGEVNFETALPVGALPAGALPTEDDELVSSPLSTCSTSAVFRSASQSPVSSPVRRVMPEAAGEHNCHNCDAFLAPATEITQRQLPAPVLVKCTLRVSS